MLMDRTKHVITKQWLLFDSIGILYLSISNWHTEQHKRYFGEQKNGKMDELKLKSGWIETEKGIYF